MVSESDEGGLEETRSFRVLSPGSVISHYRIIEKIGAGGMGVVYKAEDTKLKRLVALKFLPPHLTQDPEAKSRFMHEAQSASAIEHSNICIIHQIDETDEGQMFIAMACYEGETLRTRLERGPLELDEALDIAMQVAQGLSKVHSKGIAHRDIKPGNIMITPDGVVKVMDFGLAKLAGQAAITKTGTVLGTIAYMSPEQARGEGVDGRTDIWSLGAILYEMLTGRPPFRGEYEQAVIYSILNEEPEPVSAERDDTPVEVETIVSRALAKGLDSRYRDIEDLLSNLRKISQLGKSGAGKDSFIPKVRQPSVAVLPFSNLSADPDQEYFCDGMAEEIINALTHVEGLRVVARTSAFAFKGKSGDIREIGKQLDVESLLEGSVQKAGDRLRITAQLVKVADGYQIWSEKFDREMEDVFAIQDEISLAIVDSLRVRLLGKHKAELAKRHTEDLEAYQFYLKGRYFWNRRTRASLEKAVGYFKQSIEKDPAYAFAQFGLADAYHVLYSYGFIPLAEAYPNAKRAALRALELDDSLAGAHTSMGKIKCGFENDPDGAEQEFRRAIELNPGYATGHHWYSTLLIGTGRFKEAMEEGERALELDPLSIVIKLHVAELRTNAWNWDGAEELYRHALEIDAANEHILAAYALFLSKMERPEEALLRINRALELAPGNPFIMAYHMAILYYAREYDKAIEVGLRLLGMTPVHPFVPAMIGMDYITKGMHEEALEALRKARELLSEEHTPDYLFADLTEACYGVALAKAGRRDEAQEVLAGLLEESRRAYHSPFVMSVLHIALDDINSCFDWLERAYEEHDGWLPSIRVDALLDDIRLDPRYTALLKEMGFPE